MKVLVTGATGYFGRALVRRFLESGAMRVVLYSRSESRQAAVAESLGKFNAARFFIGDVRDRERLEEAMWGCDTVVHAAALKRIDAVAYNPGEVRKTNVLGSSCVAAAAITAKVKRVLMISSDKAAGPENAYGVSKALMEWEAIATNAISVPRGTAISCTRWGNVLGSTGSVIHLWRRQAAAGDPLTVTDPDCTRFWITLPQAVAFVLWALEHMRGGEMFVPELPSMRLGDLAAVVAPDHPVKIVGLRPGGEKRHETLVTAEEMTRTVRLDGRFVIEPTYPSWRYESWGPHLRLPAEGVAYRSDTNVEWLTPEAMGALLTELAEVVL